MIASCALVVLIMRQPIGWQLERLGDFFDVGFLHAMVGIKLEAADLLEIDHPTAWIVVVGVAFE